MKTLFVIDIDGTISDASQRFKEAGPEPDRTTDVEGHDLWLKRVQSEILVIKDEPVKGMRNLLDCIYTVTVRQSEVELIYLTARTEDLRQATELWLYKNKFPMHADLFMRAVGDKSKSGIYKEQVIQREVKNKGYEAVVVIDDDPLGDIEEMCKRNGYTFLKAKSGGTL